MGHHQIAEAEESLEMAFKHALLNDLVALEHMLAHDLVDDVTPRMGAERELFLVDSNLRPAPVASPVLAQLQDPRFTTEMGKFNLEINLAPRMFGGDCLRAMEKDLDELIARARSAAREHSADILMTGILPTAHQYDLSLDNLTPCARYRELNRVMTKLRGGPYNILIKGIDELQITHDNVMPEACCTSFQAHFQVEPKNFAKFYNAAQLVAAPLLAAAGNSPLFLGQRLWSETRVAVFQHSVDDRSRSHMVRNHPARVSFGERWLDQSVLEIFREELARFRVIMTTGVEEDALAILARGGVPQLAALRFYNGTVWRWNRPCYGVVDGHAHLRIEARAWPSGPSILDEVANAAFFFGLLTGIPRECGDVEELMPFEDAKDNFFVAARHGLSAQFIWFGGHRIPASALILDHLLPIAREGLRQSGVDSADIHRYLGTIEERVRSDRTGSQWTLQSLAAMDPQASREARHRCITAAMLRNQQTGEPVHTWELASLEEAAASGVVYRTVEDCMSTDLFTLRPDDLAQLAASVMDWRRISHVPVEDDSGRLIGLVSYRGLLHVLAADTRSASVRDIMIPNPVAVSPDTPLREAIDWMRKSEMDCLPVMTGDRLVGILTAHDVLRVLSNGAWPQPCVSAQAARA